MKGVFLFFFLLTYIFNSAQEITRDTPFSLQHNLKKTKEYLKVKPLNLKKIQKEDSLAFLFHQQFNVARLQEVSVDVKSNKNWEYLADGKQIWRIKLQAPKTNKIALKFKNLNLPKGSQLFMYSEGQTEDFQSFSAIHQDYSQSHFISKAFQSETIVLEYNQVGGDKLVPNIEVEGLVNFYRPENRANPGFGQSTSCEVNTACSEADGWCNEVESVVRIFIQAGTHYSYCSGAVVNNTKQDFTPYVLTAEHCGEYATDEDFQYWKFDFTYQSLNCNSPSSESELFTTHINGCEQIAKARRIGSSGSDFRLIKLLDSIPQEWNIYYAGWDVEEYNSISDGGVGIHHPYGDIKKISTYAADLLSSDAAGNNASDEFWKTYWVPTENGYGITEAGSSGSPLFNSEGLIIGTLATGSSYCDNMNESSPDYYGKISRHWDDNGTDPDSQLKTWLDPLNSGVLQLGGISANQTIECGDKINFKDLTIYPNPANTHIRIGNDDLTYLSDALIEIYDVRGMLAYFEWTDSNLGIKKINIDFLEEGVYVLKVTKSNWLIQQKFVILR